MTTPNAAPPQLPGSSRAGFRQFFLSLGLGLIAVTGYFAFQKIPLPVIGIILLAAGIMLVLGLLLPDAKPFTAVEQTSRTMGTGEVVLKSGAASHAQGWENRAGTLNLTNERLAFFSNGTNFRDGDVVIPLADVQHVAPATNLGIVPNAMRVVLRDNSAHRFTVFGRKSWIDAIQTAAQQHLASR